MGIGPVVLDLDAHGLAGLWATQLMQFVHGLPPPVWAPSGETTKAITSAASVAAAVNGSAFGRGLVRHGTISEGGGTTTAVMV